MSKSESFEDRFRPSNSAEAGCYTLVLITFAMIIYIGFAGQGLLGNILAVSALATFEITNGWVENKHSATETFVETIIMLTLSVTFALIAILFESWIDSMQIAEWIINITRWMILIDFVAVGYFLIQAIRKQNRWPIQTVAE